MTDARTEPQPRDLIVIGAGPIGLATAIEAQRAGLNALVIEKGALVNSFVGYPTNMELFSTPDLIEIGGYPLVCRGYKPLREECLDYYRRVAAAEEVEVRLYEPVTGLEGEAGAFTVVTERGRYPGRAVAAATGFFDVPNRLGVPGESLPKVTHYFKEPYPYAGQRVAVIGAKNSAAKAALACQRHGADVTLVHRGPEVSSSVKYWIRPNLVNRIRDGAIRAFFDTELVEIRPDSLLLRTPDGPVELGNDWVLAMTGYRPNYPLLEALGVAFEGPHRKPVVDMETMETNRPGVYLAGTVCGGLDTSEWFIENGRDHARRLVGHVAQRAAVAA
ncbi:MAG: YpdA family putative bacillithiol disulfide reductase [Rhodothermales bacterium]|nr:YpdA family putative bacillithiol disulfide reductase [Rhodothermales bacterium]